MFNVRHTDMQGGRRRYAFATRRTPGIGALCSRACALCWLSIPPMWLATKHAEPFRNISGDETRETKVAHYILGPFLRGVKGGGEGPSVWARVCHDATRDTRFPPWTGRCVGRKAPLALKTGHPNMLGPEAI